MNNTTETLRTAGKLLLNKGVAIIALAALVARYLSMADALAPLAELLYAGILIAAIIVIAPVVRLLVFPTAAQIAENGGIAKAIYNRDTFVLLHYWIATAISYLVTLLCVSSLL